MKANSKNAVKARTSAKANATTPNSTTNLAQKSAKIISTEQNYLQSKAKLYILKCFVELDFFLISSQSVATTTMKSPNF